MKITREPVARRPVMTMVETVTAEERAIETVKKFSSPPQPGEQLILIAQAIRDAVRARDEEIQQQIHDEALRLKGEHRFYAREHQKHRRHDDLLKSVGFDRAAKSLNAIAQAIRNRGDVKE